MARVSAASRKKKPQSRLLALLALSWACLQTAQPVRALAGPTVRAALFDPRTPAFWLSRCSSRPSTSSSISTGPHRQLRPLRVSPRRAVQASEPSESKDDKDKIVASARDEQLQKTAQEKEDKGFDEPTEQDTLSQKLLEMAVKTWDGAQKDLDGAREDLDGAREDRDFARQRLREAVQNGDEKERKEAREEFEKAESKVGAAKEEAKRAESKVQAAKEEATKAREELEKAKSTAPLQAIKTVSEKDLQNLANISGPNVTIEDWMVGLGRCGTECLKDIQTFAPKSDSPVDRVPPLMLSRCMRGGKTTFLVYLFELVRAEPGYLPIFISFNGFFGIQRKRGESRLQTILRAIAVTLLPATPTDTQSVSCDEDTLCDHLERQNGTIVLMIDELNLLVPKGTTDNEVASFLRRVFLSPENRYLVFTTHEPFDGSQVAEYTGGKSRAYSPRGVIARDLPRSVNVTEQRGIPQCRALSAGNVLFFSGIPALLRSWKQQYSFQARFEQLTKPKKTPGLLESFVREFLDGRRQSGDAIRAFDCLTATSDQGDAKWILCYAAQMCSYLNQLELADWINRLQTDASDPLSGKGWEVLVVLAVAFRCLEAMARGRAAHPLLGLPPQPNIQECYFWNVPSEVSTLDEALVWWARQDIPPTFPFVAVLNPQCSTFEFFDCILLYQRSKLSVLQVRGFQQKAGNTYPDKNASQDVDCVWMQGMAAEYRRSEQAKGWTLPSAREIRAFLGASLRDLFPKELDT